jgi:hypothetical protein
MVAEGKLHIKFDTVQVSEKFAKRDFVVEVMENPLYPQHVLFQLTQDKTGLLDGHNVGDKIEVTFNLRGREWASPQGEVKYFNTLEAWRIQAVVGSANSPEDLSKRTVLPTDKEWDSLEDKGTGGFPF